MQHGKVGSYTRGCRCDACCKAGRDHYSKRYHENPDHFKRITKKSLVKRYQEMSENPNDRAHGTTTGYNYGCRCDRCKKAMKVRNFERSKRRSA